MHVDEYQEQLTNRVAGYVPGESEPAWRYYARDAIRERDFLQKEVADLRKELKQYKAAMTHWSERAGVYYDLWQAEKARSEYE